MLSYDPPMPANKGKKDAPTSLPAGAPAAAAATSSTVPATNGEAHAYKHHHIWLVTGPAGCGKTTVAEHLSKALDMPYVEGDSVCCCRTQGVRNAANRPSPVPHGRQH